MKIRIRECMHKMRKEGKIIMAPRLSTGRRWRNTKLEGNAVGRFREYCRDMHINFKTSDAGHGYVHFEVLVNEIEEKEANDFLMNL